MRVAPIADSSGALTENIEFIGSQLAGDSSYVDEDAIEQRWDGIR